MTPRVLVFRDSPIISQHACCRIIVTVGSLVAVDLGALAAADVERGHVRTWVLDTR